MKCPAPATLSTTNAGSAAARTATSSALTPPSCVAVPRSSRTGHRTSARWGCNRSGSRRSAMARNALSVASRSGAAPDLDATLKAFLAMAERREPERLQPHLAEVRCPVRLLLGTATHEGGVSAEEVAVLAAALPAFVVDSVAGAGHFIYEEQPAVVVEAVRRVRAS